MATIADIKHPHVLSAELMPFEDRHIFELATDLPLSSYDTKPFQDMCAVVAAYRQGLSPHERGSEVRYINL